MRRVQLFVSATLVFACAKSFAQANGFVVIAHPSQKGELSKKDVYDLYVGNLRMREVEVLEQAEGKPTRSTFYKRFLKKTPAEMKQQWSVLVFSGNRAPKVLSDDSSVLEYIKSNTNALGYVSAEFWEKMKSQFKSEEEAPVALFTTK